MGQDRRSGSYEIEPRNKFFTANRTIVEYEIRPQVTVTFLSDVDLTEIERARSSAGPAKPSYTAFVARAVALALREFPYANRRVCRPPWLFGVSVRLQRFHDCDVAVAIERELPGSEAVAFVDVIRGADTLTLQEITERLRLLAASDETNNEQWRAFSGLIRGLPNWLSKLLIRSPYFAPGLWVKYRGGAVLISSPAKYGVDGVVTTWSWPLGISFGLVRERPVVKQGSVVACPTFSLTLNFDRRVMAGAQAARFFHRIVELLEQPEAATREAANGVESRRTMSSSV